MRNRAGILFARTESVAESLGSLGDFRSLIFDGFSRALCHCRAVLLYAIDDGWRGGCREADGNIFDNLFKNPVQHFFAPLFEI